MLLQSTAKKFIKTNNVDSEPLFYVFFAVVVVVALDPLLPVFRSDQLQQSLRTNQFLNNLLAMLSAMNCAYAK